MKAAAPTKATTTTTTTTAAATTRRRKTTMFPAQLYLELLMLMTAILVPSSVASSSSSSMMLENGCSAYDCKRTCIDSTRIRKTPGDNGFWFQIDGLRNNKYMPEKIYKVTLMGTYSTHRNTFTEFRGFLVVAVPEVWYDAMPFQPMGHFMISPNDKEIRYTIGCSEMITHANFDTKKKIEFYWSAPKKGSGCISFKAIVLQTETFWLKDDGQLTKTICEDEEPMEKNPIPECCACGQAKYSLMFKGTWTKQTHPKDWPTNEALIHWSNVIGATHSRNFSVWELGGYATPGLKELSEFGIVRTMEDELKNSSNYGVIRNIFIANGLWFPNMDKEINAAFTVSNTHHLLSFATMLGPSPDWFSGLSKLNLCLPNCTWAESHMEELYPYDAGTDSGLSYNSPNKPTNPQEKVSKITSSYPNSPKSPFYDPSGKPLPPLAKLVIKREMLRGAQCPNGQVESDQHHVESIKDFEADDLSNPVRRLQLINSEHTSFQKKGRSKAKEMKVLDNTDSRCMTTEWTEWSSCSSTCGNGLRRRSRQFKDPSSAAGARCTERLEDIEMCLSENGECEADQEETEMGESDMCNMLTSWSAWSPCSVTCGRGVTMRSRSYFKPGLETKCNSQLEEKKSCIVNEKCLDENLISMTERKRICSLEKKPGPCRMAVSNIRYYYDKEVKRCLPFEYGGCRGNENNFETKAKCERVCESMGQQMEKSSKSSVHMSAQEMEMRKKKCMQPAEEGQCYESLIKYYFDRTKMTCLPFEYSGCGGNDNNFDTIASCHQTCSFIADTMQPDEMKDSMMNVKLTMPEKKKICMSPAEKGTCSESIQRYTYSVTMNKCLLFEYSGCEGNLNNFGSIEECETVCDILIQMALQASASEEEANLEIQKKEMCMLPLEKGPCMKYVDRYYFDTSMGKCEKFTYGGCFGNDNNFESLDECESTCHSLIESAMNSKPAKIDMESQQLSYHERKTICKYPVNEGSCNGRYRRFSFNYFRQDCEPFVYTGCGGNENNFITHDSCMKTCANLDKNFTAEAIMQSNKSRANVMLYPMNCRISEWSDWSNCSAKNCGQEGEEMRMRTILAEPKFGGQECPKNLKETRKCVKSCSQMRRGNDCEVSAWGRWGECLKSPANPCDGFQERERRVTKTAMNGGKECPHLKETRKCFLGQCKKTRN